MTNDICESWTLEVTSAEQAKDAIESGVCPTGDIRILVEESATESDKRNVFDEVQNKLNAMKNHPATQIDENTLVFRAANVENHKSIRDVAIGKTS